MQIFTFCKVYDDNLQISSRSVKRLRRYCKFSIFNMAVARHFEFVKYANFNITHGLQSKSAYLYKISSQSVERLRRYCAFLISNMAAVRHFEFLKYANFYLPHGLWSWSAFSCKTRRTETANITKDDVTYASHRHNITVLKNNIIFCDIFCFSSACPYKAL